MNSSTAESAPSADDEAQPMISLVVCTTGAPDRMQELERRLAASLDAGGAVIEALVVDNSAGASVRFGDTRIRIVRCASRGLSRARTTGCMHARGDVIVFTDDDVDFDADWPMELAAPIVEGRVDATAAPVRLGEAYTGVTTLLLREWLAEANLSGAPKLVGAGMALHRRTLGFGLWDQNLGAGQPLFAFGEEQLFEYMIRAAGANVDVVASAGVVHRPDPARMTEDGWRRTALQKGYSEAYLSHHWWGNSLARPRLRLWRRLARLWIHRRLRHPDLESELRLIESIGLARGHTVLRRTKPIYLPRATERIR